MPSKNTTPLAVRLPDKVVAVIKADAREHGKTVNGELSAVIRDLYEWRTLR
jgi:hypothetical protein